MFFSFPSETFPANTGVSIDMPSNWKPDPLGPGVMVFFDADSPPEFRSNLTISLERVEAVISLEVIAAKFNEQMTDAEQYSTLGEEKALIGGFPALLRAQTLQPPGADLLVFQAQCLVLVPTANRSYNDLVVVHASCSAAHSERYGTAFRQMFESLDFDRS
jgi:hypothetical protein